MSRAAKWKRQVGKKSPSPYSKKKARRNKKVSKLSEVMMKAHPDANKTMLNYADTLEGVATPVQKAKNKLSYESPKPSSGVKLLD